MEVAEPNLSAEPFDHLKCMICTNRKMILVYLLPTSAAIKGHLLQVYFFTIVFFKDS